MAGASAPLLAQTAAEPQPSGTGPLRLRQALVAETPRADTTVFGPIAAPAAPRLVAPAKLGEFETYVRSLNGSTDIRRFGTELLALHADASDSGDYNPEIPPDYVLRAGDELVVTLWGSVDADLRLQVDRSGRIVIPRVGPIMVSGVRYADLPETISRRVAQVFKNFQLSVSLGQLRGVRVYVTGFVERPGPVLVNSLSTLMHALLRAGGPSAAGSFRDIQLRRGRQPVANFDLYDVLLKGDRVADQVVQPEDVIHVGPVATQAAMIGSVNRPAIFEVKRDETVADLLRMAGGYSAVADRSRLSIERLDERAAARVQQVNQPAANQLALRDGDVLRAFNAVDAVQSTQRQNTRVRIEGEVLRPGEYVLPAASSIADALRAAGGLAPGAFLYGSEFTRESVRVTQQRNYDRSLRDFETQIARAQTTRSASSDDMVAIAAASTANARLLEQLRALKPTGRIVLSVTPTSTALPDLALEDGDRLYIPARPQTVGVFGSVFNPGSYLVAPQRTVADYLQLAGGPTRSADESSVFTIRANGTVISSLQYDTGWFSRGNRIASTPAEPGDTIFVPDDIARTSWVQPVKDWTQILYQFGLGLAGIRSAVR